MTIHSSIQAALFAAALLMTTPTASPKTQNPEPTPTAATEGCCGPITPAGKQLLNTLLTMDVEHHWLANRRIDWKTGDPTGQPITKPDTHCSAFAAAAGERLGIYLLRPPEHPQLYLASAQGLWFSTDEARARGWHQVATARDAQRLANEGQLVVLNFVNPVPGEHGHIAIVRPALKSEAALAEDGPETMQAGKTNFADGNAKRSFASHKGAWPTQVTIWSHPTHLQD